MMLEDGVNDLRTDRSAEITITHKGKDLSEALFDGEAGRPYPVFCHPDGSCICHMEYSWVRGGREWPVASGDDDDSEEGGSGSESEDDSSSSEA